MADKTPARKGICQGLATFVVLRSLDRCLSAGEKVINRSKPFRARTLVSPRHSLQNSNCHGDGVSSRFFSKMFLRGCVGGCGDFEIELRKIKIREHALKLAERLSETKSSCSLPISVFSMFPDFVIFLVLWSGAEAANIFPQNTSSIISYG